MILRKYMSLLGIGAAKIDLILQKEAYRPGDPVHGYFIIKGGTIEQQLKRIDCDLVVMDKISGTEKVIDSTTILTSTRIDSEESNKISFAFQLPDSVLASTEEITYRFKTRLTFNEGVTSRDQDLIQIIQ
ncbi:sporulation protein [Peribacillus cavernae]|uniref:Sporulation protein n=1 Tax=Peribacillus cavernae TaxID=1674310 RepID=A0A433HAD2_9BACI|nr:sporulation protein [Peribacillus cavernae]MDQ0219743.1 sporulation-control protein [Peribacillus cavernae]RUQ25162.1 sporulation protein [Peribacillus cavernae]